VRTNAVNREGSAENPAASALSSMLERFRPSKDHECGARHQRREKW
jgi:hypothetical protein